MVALIDLLIVLLPLMYGLAAVNYLIWFVRRDPFAAKFSTPWMLGTVGMHALFLLLRSLHFARHPIGNMAESLSVVAFTLAAVYLYVEQVQRTRTTGTSSYPWCFVSSWPHRHYCRTLKLLLSSILSCGLHSSASTLFWLSWGTRRSHLALFMGSCTSCFIVH